MPYELSPRQTEIDDPDIRAEVEATRERFARGAPTISLREILAEREARKAAHEFKVTVPENHRSLGGEWLKAAREEFAAQHIAAEINVNGQGDYTLVTHDRKSSVAAPLLLNVKYGLQVTN